MTVRVVTQAKHLKKPFAIFVSSLASSLVLGCAPSPDISATRRYAQKFSKQSESIFEFISSDIHDSCLRTASYKFGLIGKPSEMRKQVDDNTRICNEKNAEAKNAVKAAHLVIREYIGGLSLLAGSGLFVVTPEIQKIESALLKLPQVSEDERQEAVKSASLITQLISEVVLERYQKKKIASVISSSDEALSTLVATLNQSITEHYTNGLLESELQEMERVYSNPIFYSGNINNAAAVKGGVTQYITTAMMLQWSDAINKVNTRKGLANEYVALLSSLSCEHSRLNDRLSSTENAVLRNQNCQRPSAGQALEGVESLDLAKRTAYFEEKLNRLDQIAKSLAE